ncbi:alpha-2,3-sialyltransferase [Campylobacter lari]|nr:alpha-2,3-sialyltransferase [Campylobacter lari]
MQKYYIENALEEFGNTRDSAHQLSSIMRKLGKNIANNINNFKKNAEKKPTSCCSFHICQAKDLLYKKQQNINLNNTMYNENAIRINKDDVLKFPSKYIDMQIIAIHTWNYDKNFTFDQCLYNFSNIHIYNQRKSILKSTNFLNSVVELQEKIIIDNNTSITCSISNNCTEFYASAISWTEKSMQHDTLNLISFFLKTKKDIEGDIDLNCLKDKDIQIPQQINFNYLIPPIKWCKEVINEYCSIMDPRKLAPLQIQITNLTNEKQNLISERANLQNQLNQFQNTLNFLPIKKQQLEISNLEQDLINKKLQTKQLSKKLGIKMNDLMPKITIINPSSAKARIQNQLSYKLGQAMIVNSKSILGYIRMPFVLSYIKDKHKQEQKIYQEKIKKDPSLKLPPLESYPDYQEALKEKECLTYKLGQSLIKANKTWYKGGYVRMWFEIKKLKVGYKN